MLAAGLVIFIIVCVNAMLTFSLKSKPLSDSLSGEVTVECTVTDKIYSGEASTEYTVRDIRIIHSDGEEKLKGKAVFESAVHKNFECGEVLRFKCRIYKYRLSDNGEIYYYNILREDAYGISVTDENSFVRSGYNAKPEEVIRSRIKSVIYNSMGPKTAGLSYALVTGDKSGIDSGITENFRSAGLSHILAISGLHINFITLIIIKVLSLCKAGRKTEFFITVAVLFAFTALCGFPASCVRALIMAAVYLGAKLTGREYDTASSVSFAALIILLFSPFMLFNAGFLLSFTAVGGICILYPVLTGLFKKKNFIIENAAVSISAQAFSTPFVLAVFGEFSLVGVLCNLIAIPFIGIIYPLLVVFVLLAAIIPVLSAIPAFLEFPMRLFMDISEISSLVPFGTLSLDFNYAQAALILMWGIAVSRFSFLKPKIKWIITAFVLAAFTGLFWL